MPEIMTPEETERRLPLLYDRATEMQIALEPAVRDTTTPLTAGQVGAYNQLLADVRALLPHSVALREDAGEAGVETRPADVYRALHTTIIPTLHNALPPDAYERRS